MSSIVQKIEHMERVIRTQYANQVRIFGYLNSYARGDHMQQYSRVDPNGVLGQVYGDLASCFAELEAIAKEIRTPEEKDGQPLS